MRRAVVLSCGLVIGALLACSESTSPSAGEDGEDAGSDAADATADVVLDGPADASEAASCTLPGVYGSKACNACVAARCCGLITACENDVKCKPLQACVLECPTKPDAGGCYQGCLATHPEGRALWDPIFDCWYHTPPEGCLVECT
jgi:hypothetical protein